MEDGSVVAASSGSQRAIHRVHGPRLEAGADGIRVYIVECQCGWRSEQCASSVLAEADGEQHLTLAASSRTRNSRREALSQDQ